MYTVFFPATEDTSAPDHFAFANDHMSPKIQTRTAASTMTIDNGNIITDPGCLTQIIPKTENLIKRGYLTCLMYSVIYVKYVIKVHMC